MAKTKPANKKQRDLMANIAKWANEGGMEKLYPGVDCSQGIQLHHVLGRSAKQNKVAIGHEFVIPVPYQYHDINEKNSLNVSYFKHNFTDKFGMQRHIWNNMIFDMVAGGYEAPAHDVHLAIMTTNA